MGERADDSPIHSLPRAVDGAHRQSRELDRVIGAIHVEHVDDCLGNDAVQTDRVPGVTLLDRQIAQRHIAVQRRARQRRDNLRTLHARRLEHRRSRPARRGPPGCTPSAGRQPGKVVHHVRLTQCGQRGELVGKHVERMDLQRAAGRTRLGKVGEGAAGEIVDDIDGVALGDEAIDQVGTEEPGSTDDQDVHVASAGGRYSPDSCSPGSDPAMQAEHAACDVGALADLAHDH